MSLVDKVGTWISDIYLSSVFLEQVAFTAPSAPECHERLVALLFVAAIVSFPRTRALMYAPTRFGVTAHSLASAGVFLASSTRLSLSHSCGTVAVAVAWFGRMYGSDILLDDPEVRRQTLSLPLGFLAIATRRFLSGAPMLLSCEPVYGWTCWVFVLFCCAIQWHRSHATTTRPRGAAAAQGDPEATLCAAARLAPVSPLLVGSAMCAAAISTQLLLSPSNRSSSTSPALATTSNLDAKQSTLLVSVLFLLGIFKSASMFPAGASDGVRRHRHARVAVGGAILVGWVGLASYGDSSADDDVSIPVSGLAAFLQGAAWPVLMEAGNDWAAASPRERHHKRRLPWIAAGFAVTYAAAAAAVESGFLRLQQQKGLLIAIVGPQGVALWYAFRQYSAIEALVTKRPDLRTLDVSGRTLCTPVFGCLFALVVVSYAVASV